MEYVPLGDLEKNVLACSGKVPEPEARDIAEQVLSALQIMHAESFAHRNLKPQVCTLSSKWRSIVTPFVPNIYVV
jgi:calcium/calmodulin-dependent protein kinase I